MLFNILYIVMSVNRFDTKLWLLLDSLLEFLFNLKMGKYQNLFYVFRRICIWKTVETNILV